MHSTSQAGICQHSYTCGDYLSTYAGELYFHQGTEKPKTNCTTTYHMVRYPTKSPMNIIVPPKKIGGFHSHGGTPIAGWFLGNSHLEINDSGVPLFQETSNPKTAPEVEPCRHLNPLVHRLIHQRSGEAQSLTAWFS